MSFGEGLSGMTELRWENQMCVFLFDVHRHTELAGKQQSLLAMRKKMLENFQAIAWENAPCCWPLQLSFENRADLISLCQSFEIVGGQ